MINAIDVIKDYRNKGKVHRALSGVRSGLQKAKKLAVLGRNGAGKSTPIRLIGGRRRKNIYQMEPARALSDLGRVFASTARRRASSNAAAGSGQPSSARQNDLRSRNACFRVRKEGREPRS
jgi:ATPase subunit of ABC transporter with duplicated ATPase domains